MTYEYRVSGERFNGEKQDWETVDCITTEEYRARNQANLMRIGAERGMVRNVRIHRRQIGEWEPVMQSLFPGSSVHSSEVPCLVPGKSEGFALSSPEIGRNRKEPEGSAND